MDVKFRQGIEDKSKVGRKTKSRPQMDTTTSEGGMYVPLIGATGNVLKIQTIYLHFSIE